MLDKEIRKFEKLLVDELFCPSCGKGMRVYNINGSLKTIHGCGLPLFYCFPSVPRVLGDIVV